MNNHRCIRISNDLSRIGELSEALRDFSRIHKLAAPVNNALDLVLDEIVNNTISYGFDDDKTHFIDVRLTKLPRSVIVSIEDDGREFNPLKMREANTTSSMDERPIGGLGIHLVRKLMDEITYCRKNGRNVLTLTKRIEETAVMEIVQRKQDEVVILELSGRLDTNTSVTLEKKLLLLIEEKEHKIVIDGSKLDFISSSGLRVILMAGKKLKTQRGKIVLCSLQSHVQDVFEVAGFSMIFSILPSQAEAIKELK